MIKLNGVEIKPTIFPDKTSQVWHIDLNIIGNAEAKIEWFFESEAELIHIAQLKILLDQYGRYPELYIDYLPYARQDKKISNETTFALHAFVKLLNSIGFVRITILDPHSEEAHGIKEIRTISCYPQWDKCIDDTKPNVICFADKSALSRYAYKKPFRNYPEKDLIHAIKHRTQETGLITHLELSRSNLKRKDVLIIDDICDGGMTFRLLAMALKSEGARNVDLFVTHGLFTKGTEVLKQAGIRRIFTAKGEVK